MRSWHRIYNIYRVGTRPEIHILHMDVSVLVADIELTSKARSKRDLKNGCLVDISTVYEQLKSFAILNPVPMWREEDCIIMLWVV